MINFLRAELSRYYPAVRKQIVVSPECVTVYQGTGVSDASVGGNAWNYFVHIINLADDAIDFYQVQAYNNWYGAGSGTFEFLKEVYLNWRNLQSGLTWATPIKNFKGVTGNKLLMGVLSSTQAGGSAYYSSPTIIAQFKNWL
jgi:chitinase